VPLAVLEGGAHVGPRGLEALAGPRDSPGPTDALGREVLVAVLVNADPSVSAVAGLRDPGVPVVLVVRVASEGPRAKSLRLPSLPGTELRLPRCMIVK